MPPEVGLLKVDKRGRYFRYWDYPEKGLHGISRHAGVIGTIHCVHIEFVGPALGPVERTMPIGTKEEASSVIFTVNKLSALIEQVAEGIPNNSFLI